MGLFDIFKSKDTRPKKYDHVTWFEYAQRQEAKGNWQEAAKCYETIIKRTPGHKEAYYQLFECYRHLKQWKRMIQYGRQFEDKFSIWKLEWGRNAILDAQAELSREYAQSQQSANKGKDNNSQPTAGSKQAKADVPQYGVVLKTKMVGDTEVKEVTWVDEPEPEPEPEPQPEAREEPKPKVFWPVKADFKPKPKPDDKMTMGANFDRFCSQFPPYMFYVDEPRIPEKVIEQCHGFLKPIEMARVEIEDWEANRHYENAAVCCEIMTQCECWEPWPYTKLMEIYKGAGLLKDAEELRQYSIKFFTARRNRMEQQMLEIIGQEDADFQDMVRDMISSGKEIWYYRGLFKLYDPYPCIEEWQKMGDLSK